MDIPKLRKLLALDPNDSLSRYALGRKLWEQANGDPAHTTAMLAESIGHLRFATAVDPSHLATYHVLSRALLDAGLPDEARPVIKQGLARTAHVTEGMGKDLGPLLADLLASIGQHPAVRPDPATVRIEQVLPEAVIPLRHKVLRPGMDRSAAIFPGDDAPSAIHIAALSPTNQVLCCATMHDEPYTEPNSPPVPSWRLRGMATEPAWQATGLGHRVLLLAEQLTQQSRRTSLLWCNARLPALAFYKANGWQTRGQQYLIPTAGPHFTMIKPLT
jgi:predicted GNAT family N-acyltransferase